MYISTSGPVFNSKSMTFQGVCLLGCLPYQITEISSISFITRSRESQEVSVRLTTVPRCASFSVRLTTVFDHTVHTETTLDPCVGNFIF